MACPIRSNPTGRRDLDLGKEKDREIEKIMVVHRGNYVFLAVFANIEFVKDVSILQSFAYEFILTLSFNFFSFYWE